MDDRYSEGRSEALVRRVPQNGAPGGKTGGERWHIISAIANSIIALANILIVAVMFKGCQGDGGNSKRLDDAVSALKSATQHVADIDRQATDVKKQLEDALAIQREGLEAQKRAASALEGSARGAKQMATIEERVETKPPQVDVVYLGDEQLAKNEDGSFSVHSFTGCPQLKIRVYNPGSLPISAAILVSGSKNQESFRCPKRPDLQLAGYEKINIFLNLRDCFRGFSECSGGGSIVVRAEKR